eukprot:s270_g5.t1
MCFQPARRCLHDQSLKFLVQIRDDVEAGDERIKELETMMNECGLFDADFSLGDLLDEGDEESELNDLYNEISKIEVTPAGKESLSCNQATSATAAVRQAKNTSKVAKWSTDKLHLDELGEVDGKRASNKNRNLVKCLAKKGLLLGAPITYIKGVDGEHDVFSRYPDPDDLSYCLPCLVHGDEGVGHRRKPVLQLLWGPLLRVGLGASDRLFLITTCPHKYYSGHNEGVAAGNPVIDRLMKECARSACKAYYQGIPTKFGTFKLVFFGLAGDHPFQTKVSVSWRGHLRNEICPWCEANTYNVPFEDCSSSAKWRRTLFHSVPWKVPPPFAIIPGGDHPSFIKWDLMHMVPHGCARNFCASVVCMLCGPMGMFAPPPGPGLKKDRCLRACYSLLDSWLMCVGKSMRDLKEFTPENLQWKLNRDFPDSNCKASDCNLLTKWLLDLIGTMPWEMTEPLKMAYEGLESLDQFQRLFMDPARQLSTRDACVGFLSAYSRLAVYWHSQNWCLFGYTPKYHYTGHWDHELSEAIRNCLDWAWNPGAFSTPMMEDFVGLTSRISRSVHAGTVAQHMRVLDVDDDTEFLEQQVSEERIHDIMKASMSKVSGSIPKDAETLQSCICQAEQRLTERAAVTQWLMKPFCRGICLRIHAVIAICYIFSPVGETVLKNLQVKSQGLGVEESTQWSLFYSGSCLGCIMWVLLSRGMPPNLLMAMSQVMSMLFLGLLPSMQESFFTSDGPIMAYLFICGIQSASRLLFIIWNFNEDIGRENQLGP